MKKFTLVELILVVLILGLISSSALLVVDTQDSQIRYEETKRRLEQIDLALLGNQWHTFNNQVQISGYLADTGSTPSSLQDLISKPSLIENWAYNEILGFGSGWRGPYITSFNSEFRDGWGYTFKGLDNSDWDGIESDGSFNIRSFGEDNNENGSDYERDISLSIPKTKYQNDTSIVFSINVINNALNDITTTDNIRLLVFYPDSELPTNFDIDEWGDLNETKFLCEEEYDDITLLKNESTVLNFTLNQELIYRKVRLLLVNIKDGSSATQTLSEKIVSDEETYVHAILNPYSAAVTTQTLRVIE